MCQKKLQEILRKKEELFFLKTKAVNHVPHRCQTLHADHYKPDLIQHCWQQPVKTLKSPEGKTTRTC